MSAARAMLKCSVSGLSLVLVRENSFAFGRDRHRPTKMFEGGERRIEEFAGSPSGVDRRWWIWGSETSTRRVGSVSFVSTNLARREG